MKYLRFILLLSLLINKTVLLAAPALQWQKTSDYTGVDSVIVLVPFEYKQSALYHADTYEVIDSVVTLLLSNTAITLTINGYAHPDEGSDTICKYLSLNRALFVKGYILGRGVNESRIILVQGMGKARSVNNNVNKDGHILNCRAELLLNFPPPPAPVIIADRDEDGIADADDACPDEYGYADKKGCKDKDVILIPFTPKQSWLTSFTYSALDGVVALLKQNKALTISIEGHAYKTEGITSFCDRLSNERAAIVKRYLLSRNILKQQITTIKNFGTSRPYNGGNNPQEVEINSRAQIIILK